MKASRGGRRKSRRGEAVGNEWRLRQADVWAAQGGRREAAGASGRQGRQGRRRRTRCAALEARGGIVARGRLASFEEGVWVGAWSGAHGVAARRRRGRAAPPVASGPGACVRFLEGICSAGRLLSRPARSSRACRAGCWPRTAAWRAAAAAAQTAWKEAGDGRKGGGRSGARLGGSCWKRAAAPARSRPALLSPTRRRQQPPRRTSQRRGVPPPDSSRALSWLANALMISSSPGGGAAPAASPNSSRPPPGSGSAWRACVGARGGSSWTRLRPRPSADGTAASMEAADWKSALRRAAVGGASALEHAAASVTGGGGVRRGARVKAGRRTANTRPAATTGRYRRRRRSAPRHPRARPLTLIHGVVKQVGG